jgi:adenine-specific DNA-methyltransferase
VSAAVAVQEYGKSTASANRRERRHRYARTRQNPSFQAVSRLSQHRISHYPANVDCIKDGLYIDPPYNTGSDFVYADDFADPMARYKEVTQQTTKSNPETAGRFHTNWLNMIYPRLRFAANLLRDDGVIFISIDDHEVHNLRKVCDEIFGEENFVACLVFDKNRKNDAKYFSVGHEYMLMYFKSKLTQVENNTVLRVTKEGIDEVRVEFERLRKLHSDDWTLVNAGLKALYASWDENDERKSLARFTKVDEKGPYRDDGNINWPGTGGTRYDVYHPITEKLCKKPISGWRYSSERLQEEIDKGHVVFGPDETTVPRVRSNLFESDTEVMKSVMFSYAQTATNELQELFDGYKVFDNPKNYHDIRKLIEYITSAKDGDIILDFFSGSATTAHAVLKQNAEDGGNRRFVLVQLPENLDLNYEAATGKTKAQLQISIDFLKSKNLPHYLTEIGKERIRRAGQMTKDESPITTMGLDVGFRVYKLDSSNLKMWDDSPVSGEDALAELEARIRGMLDIIKPDRSEEDVVCEVMLKLGHDLSEEVTAIDVNGKTIYGVGDILVCLAQDIKPEDAEAMAEYSPARIVFADRCFENSTDKSNVKLTLKDRGIGIKVL